MRVRSQTNCFGMPGWEAWPRHLWSFGLGPEAPLHTPSPPPLGIHPTPDR
jgi:hypothetical protein